MLAKLLIFVALVCAVKSYVVINIYDTDTGVEASKSAISSCDWRECDQRCRRMFFPGGTCVNGRCKCDIRSDEKDAEAKSSEDLKSESCDSLECILLCNLKGFPGGTCDAYGQCICDTKTNKLKNKEVSSGDQNDIENESNILNATMTCDLQQCDSSCQNKGFPGGFCDHQKDICICF